MEEGDDPARGRSFPIVGVGASAGGLEAFSELVKSLPLDTGMGFVLLQHLDPQHDSALAQLLARATSLPVREATDNLRVRPNHVYVIPPNKNLGIAGGVLTLRPLPRTRTSHRCIDFFLQALAADQHERAIGVVLSGTATDGTLGLEAIKAEGGITFAQDDSARYDSMPRSAVAAGCVDFVLSPRDIANELARIARHPSFAEAVKRGDVTAQTKARRARAAAARGGGEKGRESTAEDGFRRILRLLHNRSGVDFSLYKSSTIQRRILRRMVLNKQDTLDHYARFLRGNARELDALYLDALISVTSFFRDPEAFDVLQRKIWPALLHQRGDEPLRAWVPGCSSGQEAYSIAISFVEAAERVPRARSLQVFATDLNEALLDKARRGLYAKSLVQDLSPERLRRFFVEEQGGYRVSKPLREMVIFARQNLISDPPFSRMDLISCRNLLIYLEPDLQRKLIPVFHYALRPGGFLYLGASESIGGFTGLFAQVDKKHRIYGRRAATMSVLQLPVRRERGEAAPSGAREDGRPLRLAAERGGAVEGLRAVPDAQREADRVSVNQFAPPGVLINGDLQILQFRGATAAYLEPPAGTASFDVLKMARRGLMLPVRAAINEARKENKTARREGVRIEQDGKTRAVNVEVIPLKNLREPCFLVVFEDLEKAGRVAPGAQSALGRRQRPVQAPSPAGRSPRSRESRRISALETELSEMRDYLQSIQEQHEAANEELQSSNEEVQSANEELQSINEELETSKEELESTNEELITVNEEMANRNAELSRLNSDLVNVQTSAHLPIVLLGRDLTIRRFSVQAEKDLNLVASDVGRPFGTVRHNLDVPDLETFITDVIDTVRGREREVQDRGGRWVSLRVRPYLTLDNKVDGAVLVLVDIDGLKRTERALANARNYAENIIETVREPLLVLDSQFHVESANRSFYRTFRVEPDETLGKCIFEVGNRQWDAPGLRTLLEEILARSNVLDDFPVEHTFEQLGRRTMLLNARRMHNPERQAERILLAIEDITERKQAEDGLRQSEAQFRALSEASPALIWRLDPNGCFSYVNPRFLEYFAQTTEAALGGGWRPLLHPDDTAAFLAGVAASQGNRARLEAEARVRDNDGAWRWIESYALPLFDAKDQYLGHVGVSLDITERRQYENALSEADARKNEFLAMLAHELRNPLAPVRNALDIMRRIARGDSPERTATRAHQSGARRTDPSRSAEWALDLMERQVGQMVRLVDDLLDIGRISRGKLELRTERVELSSVVQDAVEAARPLFESVGQDLTVTFPPAPVYLDADPTRLAQIVGNLLNNACKFTDRDGRIWLTVEAEEESSTTEKEGALSRPPPHAVIRVRDTGIGIAADKLPSVFDLFTQADTSLERSLTGLGIGLTLVKSLAHLHGGTVEAHSAGLGQGSEFVVRLPTVVETSSPAPEPTRAEPNVTKRLRILVVDDNRDAAECLATLLQFSGHETHVAHDGLEAVEATTRLLPDVVLLDIGLPRLDGCQAARRIRERHGDKNLVLVAVTGLGRDEDRHRSEEAGFDAHLVKPVDVVALMELLVELGVG